MSLNTFGPRWKPSGLRWTPSGPDRTRSQGPFRLRRRGRTSRQASFDPVAGCLHRPQGCRRRQSDVVFAGVIFMDIRL